MSITIQLNTKQLSDENTLQMHFLPAKINGDGKANVDKYFNNYTREHSEIREGLLTNSLRGYPVLGERLPVPPGYKGVVLQETKEAFDESAERQLRITGTFQEFTYWNYDKIPTKADGYKQALQMYDIAEALSEPITANEIEEELKRRKLKLVNNKKPA